MADNQEKSTKGIKYAKKILYRVSKIPINKNYKLEEYADKVYNYRTNRRKKFSKQEARDYLYRLYLSNKHLFKTKNKCGTVYIIGCKENKVCKIGFTQKQVEERLKSLQTGCPYKLQILNSWKGLTRKDEKTLHKTYKDHKLNGEWFKLNSVIERQLLN